MKLTDQQEIQALRQLARNQGRATFAPDLAKQLIRLGLVERDSVEPTDTSVDGSTLWWVILLPRSKDAASHPTSRERGAAEATALLAALGELGGRQAAQ